MRNAESRPILLLIPRQRGQEAKATVDKTVDNILAEDQRQIIAVVGDKTNGCKIGLVGVAVGEEA